MSTIWRPTRGHHAKKRPHEYQLPKDQRQARREERHENTEPRWDRVGDDHRD